MTTNYYFPFYYTKLGIGTAPSAAPTITVVDFSDNVLVNAEALTALANLTGAYVYIYSGADNLHLIGKAATTDVTIDQRDLVMEPSISIVLADLATIKADYARRTGDYSTLTAAQVNTLLSSSHGSGSWGAGTGGDKTLTYTLTDSVSGDPIVGASIELYATIAYSNIIDRQTTDALGQVTFSDLVAGTYYLKILKSGYVTGTDVEVVS